VQSANVGSRENSAGTGARLDTQMKKPTKNAGETCRFKTMSRKHLVFKWARLNSTIEGCKFERET
jgi:hypothetical protein